MTYKDQVFRRRLGALKRAERHVQERVEELYPVGCAVRYKSGHGWAYGHVEGHGFRGPASLKVRNDRTLNCRHIHVEAQEVARRPE